MAKASFFRSHVIPLFDQTVQAARFESESGDERSNGQLKQKYKLYGVGASLNLLN